jgi:sec-independent protein translocase protein TatC
MIGRFRRAARPRVATPDDAMTLTDHLAELRVRIIRSALAIAIGAVLIIAFYDTVLGFLRGPYDSLCASKPEGFCESRLFTLDPLEGFSTRLRIASWGGIILAMPVLLWQIWRFIVPALHAKERRYAVPFVVSSVLLFCLGGALAFLTLERALEFLIAWSGEDVEQAFQVSRYVRLVGLMVAAFGVGFLFPVLLVFLQLAGVVSSRSLLRGWRYATVGVVVLAAVITPSGDPISLAMLAGPLLVFYYLAILIGYLFERRKRRVAVADGAT